jgi:hypothetical protein
LGLGSYVFCEWASVQKEFPKFQRVFADLESRLITKCNLDWSPKTFNAALALAPGVNNYGRTTILPALFKGNAGSQLVHWRQYLGSTGHQTLLTGASSGNTLPEDFKVGWVGLAFPNKQMNISEIKFQIGDRKYGRIDLEELRLYDKPAIVFEEGFIIDEETSFELYGYVENADYQRIVPLGFCCFKVIDKVLGAPGAAIS